jgi:hypothetical protein
MIYFGIILIQIIMVSHCLFMLCLYRILCAVRFKSVKSGVGIPYPEYAVVIPGTFRMPLPEVSHFPRLLI